MSGQRAIEIIYRGPEFLIVNKPPGLLSQSDREGSEDTLSHHAASTLSGYCHLLTRLDRPVGGLAVFSSSESFTREYLQAQAQGMVVKSYLALVEGQLMARQKKLIHYAYHDSRRHKSILCKKGHPRARKLESTLDSLLQLDRYSLVQLDIRGGKFHQIRTQLAAIGHPVKNDIKYGARRRKGEPYIFLHSWKTRIVLPGGGDYSFEAALPKNIDLWGLVSDKLKLADNG